MHDVPVLGESGVTLVGGVVIEVLLGFSRTWYSVGHGELGNDSVLAHCGMYQVLRDIQPRVTCFFLGVDAKGYLKLYI